MKKYVEDTLRKQNWAEEGIESILAFFDRFTENEECVKVLEKWVTDYRKDRNIDYEKARTQIKETAQKHGFCEYEAWLVFFLGLSRYLPEHYQKAGFPLEAYEASMYDLKWKGIECKEIFGIWGIEPASWYDRFFNLQRFALGRLQFECMTEEEKQEIYEEIEKSDQKEALRFVTENKVELVNVHIPSCAFVQPLKPEVCQAAYKKAEEFWKMYFNCDEIAFCCSSWLLFPAHKEMLPEGSNILKFAGNYRIYAAEQDEKCRNLWRLFHCKYEGDASVLPEDTTLQKAYKKWLLDGNLPGAGRGIYYRKYDND